MLATVIESLTKIVEGKNSLLSLFTSGRLLLFEFLTLT